MTNARKYQYIARKNTLYELLLEGREGAGEMGAGAGKELALFPLEIGVF